MNQRLNRKEIRRDEFTQAVGKSVVYVEQHSRGLLLGIVALVVVVAAGIALYAYRSHVAELGDQALGRAMKVYQAPIDPAQPKPSDPEEPSFASEAARQARAAQLLESVRKDYGSSDAADVAGLYLGQIEAQRGHLDRARLLWSEFVRKHGRHALAGPARLNLINLERKLGHAQDAVQELRAMLDQSDAPLPQDVILYHLGSILEQQNNTLEASKSFKRILDEFPQSPYRSVAQQRLSALEPGAAAASSGLNAFPGGAPAF